MMMNSTNKTFYIGTYVLGCVNVELYYDPNTMGGSVDFRPKKTTPPKMVIGFGEKDWRGVVAAFLHESFEFCACLQDHSYVPAGMSGEGFSGDYLFSFDHTEFSRLCAYQAPFIMGAFPDLSEAFNRHWKNKKKKARRK